MYRNEPSFVGWFFLIRCEVKGQGCPMCTGCKALGGEFVNLWYWAIQNKLHKLNIKGISPDCTRTAEHAFADSRSTGNVRGRYLKSILQARQLVFLTNVCIWKLCWLAVALSGLMLDLGRNEPTRQIHWKKTLWKKKLDIPAFNFPPKKRTLPFVYRFSQRVKSRSVYSHGHSKLLHPLPLRLLGFTKELEALLPLQVDQVEAVRPLETRQRVRNGRRGGTGAPDRRKLVIPKWIYKHESSKCDRI